MHGRGLAADVLHDVDLAAARPTDRGDVVAEHPERRPHTLSAGNANASLEPAVGLGEEPLRLDARRCVATDSVPARIGRIRRLGNRSDDEMSTAIEADVLGTRRIELTLLIPPAAATGLPRPFRSIEGRAGGSVELVAPHECPRWRD